MKTLFVRSGLVSVLALCNCAIPIPTIPKSEITIRPVAKERESIHYCEALAKRADSDSVAYLTTGILFGLFSAAGMVVGNSVGPDTSPNASWVGQNRNSLITSASALLAVPATLLLMRSNSASTASAMAGDAMKLDNENEAYKKCIDIRTSLISSRNEVSDFARKHIGTNNISELKAAHDILEKDYKEKKATADAATEATKRFMATDATDKIEEAAALAKRKSEEAEAAKRKLDAMEEKMKAAASSLLTPQ
jgi:hypothetical protein